MEAYTYNMLIWELVSKSFLYKQLLKYAYFMSIFFFFFLKKPQLFIFFKILTSPLSFENFNYITDMRKPNGHLAHRPIIYFYIF